MAFKAPSGLMAQPEGTDEWVTFPLEEEGRPYGEVSLTREVWDGRDPRASELIFYVQDYGRFRLKIHG